MARLAAHRIAGLYLAQRTRFGMKFGLATMRALVAEMGHPEQAFPSLLIAGTNGKGSVAAYCDSVLRASGLRVGRYTSPHLVRVNERITVSGREISAPAFGRAVRAVRDAAARLVKRGTLDTHPTFFEVLTAAAFEHFRAQQVDVAVLEVGLGGRLDATNVVLPLASAIVSIELDHEVYLGRTLAAIAGEKAGVMRPGRPTVIGRVSAEAGLALRRHARATGALLVDATRGARWRGTAPDVELRTPLRRYQGLRPLPGAHQLANLLVAIRLLEASRQAGLPVALDVVPEAIARTRWPGRLERVAGDPPLVLDGAHNPAGARALADHLRGGPPFVLVFGAMADKDVAGLARALFPLATTVVLTEPRVSRAASPGELARRCGALARGATREASVFRALARARGLARRRAGTVVVVAGSLYLVGEVEAILERERARARRSRAAARAVR